MSFLFDPNETPHQRQARMQRMMLTQQAASGGGIAPGLQAVGSALAERFRRGGTTDAFPPAPAAHINAFPPAPSAPANLAPQGTASDVYAGLAQSGIANGGALVSRDPRGGISLTNQFGATTYTDPTGRSVAQWGGSTKNGAVAAALNGHTSPSRSSTGFGNFGFGKMLKGLFGLGAQNAGLY